MKKFITKEMIEEAIDFVVKYANNVERPLILAVMDGGVIFAVDIFKKLDEHCEFDSVKVSSYNFNKKVGRPVIIGAEVLDVEGRDVLIIDDIIDTGDTVRAVLTEVRRLECKTAKVFALVGKETVQDMEDIWFAFSIKDNDYVVGYGLDDCGYKRSLPEVYIK